MNNTNWKLTSFQVDFKKGYGWEKEDGKKLKKGETADFKVIEFNKEFKRVVASHTAIFREEEEKNVKAVNEAVANNTNAQASTLGDNNDMLAALKAKMEKNEKK